MIRINSQTYSKVYYGNNTLKQVNKNNGKIIETPKETKRHISGMINAQPFVERWSTRPNGIMNKRGMPPFKTELNPERMKPKHPTHPTPTPQPKKQDPNRINAHARNSPSVLNIKYEIIAPPFVSTVQMDGNILSGSKIYGRASVVFSVPALNPEQYKSEWERMGSIFGRFTDKKLVPIAIPTFAPEEELSVNEEKLVGHVHYLMGIPVYLHKPVQGQPPEFPQHEFFKGYTKGEHEHFAPYLVYPSGRRQIKPYKYSTRKHKIVSALDEITSETF